MFKPYNFRWTKFHENNPDFIQLYPEIQSNLAEDELIICTTVIDAENYSLLTTKRFVTKEMGIEDIGYPAGATKNTPPLAFKLEKYGYVVATIELENGNIFRYFLEAGKASMIMIYGIITLIGSQGLTDEKMLKFMRWWGNRKKR